MADRDDRDSMDRYNIFGLDCDGYYDRDFHPWLEVETIFSNHPIHFTGSLFNGFYHLLWLVFGPLQSLVARPIQPSICVGPLGVPHIKHLILWLSYS